MTAALAFFGAAVPVRAVINVNADVDLNSVKAVMPDTGIGLHTSTWGHQFAEPELPGLLADGGIELLRYPGGSYADVYQWSQHTGHGGYHHPDSHFGNFVDLLMDGSGADAMITVNYGSSLQGTMGGQPKEAAAWVAYANGNPNDTTLIGVDDEGNDWKTIGYWATLRGRTPAQNPDNQYDFLAINHDAPLGIKYWEVGNEINGNGFYNAEWEYDLHAPYDGNRGGNPALSPIAYATNFNDFVTEMKAVDPTIKIGAMVVGPGDVGDTGSVSWNANMMTIAGPNMDFASYHWYITDEHAGTNEVLWATGDLPGIYDTIRDQMDTYIGPGASDEIEIHMNEFGHFNDSLPPVIDGVFAANTYATALEEGIKSVHWLELSANSYLGNSDFQTPGPAYHGIQIFSHIAEAGAEFVQTLSDNGLVETHATVLPDGSVGLLIANLNNASILDAAVTFDIQGAPLGDSGSMWIYGVNDSDAPEETIISSGLGNQFTVNVPYRSVVALLIAAGPGVPGDYNGNGVADAADYIVWRDNLGASGTPGSIVGDGTSTGDLLGVPDGLVDEWDFAYWRANFGATAGGGSGAAASAVPEPSTLSLLALAGVLLLGRGPRRSRACLPHDF